ncbi:MAG: cytochrome c3 family protein [Acidobacteriota bacterium]
MVDNQKTWKTKRRTRNTRRRQRLGWLSGSIGATLVAAVLFVPGQESFHALGPMNTGHAEVQCSACHVKAPGTFRQQMQANARFALGLRSEPADFGLQNVNHDACIDCHQRDNDRHPVFRFNEPRFAEARRNLQPETCISCHQEHSGVRVTVAKTYCSECHGELEMKSDPLDVSHQVLVAEARWESCLGCHDFHGNHVRDTPTEIAAALAEAEIEDYFEGGDSPYSERKVYRATATERPIEVLAREEVEAGGGGTAAGGGAAP